MTLPASIHILEKTFTFSVNALQFSQLLSRIFANNTIRSPRSDILSYAQLIAS